MIRSISLLKRHIIDLRFPDKVKNAVVLLSTG